MDDMDAAKILEQLLALADASDSVQYGTLSTGTVREHVNLALAALRQHGQHPDNIAVNRFARAMKWKLAAKRAEGRSGWDDPTQCSTARLADLLRKHVAKGDPVDVGNFAMMLWNRGGATNEGTN